MKDHEILLGLTTTPRSDWREKTKEIDQLSLKKIALFPTYLKIKDREELYGLLEKSSIKRIPHVHLRDDMEKWELDYLSEKYKTKLFNIHIWDNLNKILKNYSAYLDKIYIENNVATGKEFVNSLKKVAGICLDFSHYHDLWVIQKIPSYAGFPALLKKHTIGCCHISAIRKKSVPYNSWDIKVPEINKLFSCHLLNDFSELDYVKKYIDYLPKYVSIELENSFQEQLRVKKYLEKIING